MALNTVEPLLLGVLGGLLPLAFKYFVDRFAESHKAAVAVAAKRRERFYEKQAAVIGGLYERLARWTDLAQHIRIDESDLNSVQLSDWATERLKSQVANVYQARADFHDYFIVNKIYLPLTFDTAIMNITLNLSSAAGRPWLLSISEPPDRAVTEENIRYLKASLERASEFLNLLRSQFYDLMLGHEPSRR